MSSDESTGTHISTFSTQTEKEKLKPHKPEQWEIDLIGNFLLNLYHRSLITPDDGWCITKADVRKEFEKNFTSADQIKKFKELNGTANIGTLLHRCGFLIDTPRGSNTYRIKNIELFKFRNMKLKHMDDLRVNKDNLTQSVEENLLNEERNTVIVSAEDNIEVDEEEPKKPLKYQGTTMQPRSPNYYPTNSSCCICEDEFPTIKAFEEHIQQHGEDTDFEYLNTMKHMNDPICTLYYRLCKNSHYFCFEIETSTNDLILEKIILVQSHSFYNVYNTRLSYKISQNVKNRFFIDSHLFTIHVEQPIVLICHVEGSKDIRIIEQHHFMRSEEFPKINFSINPNRIPYKTLFKSKFKLADYFPPKEILHALKDDFYHEKLMNISNDFREYVQSGKKLQPKTLGESLKILLQIEDIDTLYQYRNLTQQNVELRKFESEYSFRLKPKQRLYIENILSPFDEVVLTTRTDVYNNPETIMNLMMENTTDLYRKKNTYVGFIVALNTGRVSFKCDRTINIYSKYTIICRPSRLTMRYQYRSLELLNVNMVHLRKFLFPSKLMPMSISEVSLNLYNDKIALVPEQLQAVRNIAEGPRNDATYIIFGPPGTGKTTTLVEAILQLLKRSETKILVTASSNSACDEVALRLTKYLEQLDIKRCLVRIYARSSEGNMDTIDDDLLEHSNMYCGQFYPAIEILHEYRVVVCTLSVVAKLATGKFGRDQHGNEIYTHLFIDEVAAAMETDALMAITTILKNKSSLIISGDHKQLGPILKSKRAQELGLDISLMERLLERDCYRVDDDTGNYDRTIQTRLRRNYRSHPAIVNLYSGLYYNHNVEPHCKIEDVSLGDNWYKTKKQEFPIIFHAIYEPSMSDKQTTSLYNLGEMQVVMDYLKELMYFGINGQKLSETDIGIISPYKKQYKLIQEELNLRKWFNIETGSVEIFQGKEKEVIIVSFVRSGTQGLGFLDSPRRLNVTLSRAKSILILIGNPNTLNKNSEFDYIIKECQRHNTFVGQKPNSEIDIDTELNLAMREICLSNETIDDGNKKQRRNRGRRGKKNRGSSRKQTQNNEDVVSANDPSAKTSENEKVQRGRMFTSKYQSNGRDMMQNSGKVTKSYITGKRNNPWDSNMRATGQKIDQLFAELPQIPNTVQQNNPFNSPTSNFPNFHMNSQQLQPPHYYNMQPRPQLQQQQYCNNNLSVDVHSPLTFYNTQYPSAPLSPQQLIQTSPYHQPVQRNIDLLPGTSGGVNQLNHNSSKNYGPISNNYYCSYDNRNPFISPKKPNESENKLTMNSSQSTSKGNSAKNDKEKLATAKVNPMPRAQTPTLNKTAAVPVCSNSNASSSSSSPYSTLNQFLASASMSREGSTNNSSLKFKNNSTCNDGKTSSPLATPTKVTPTSRSNNSSVAVSPKKTNFTDAKANIGKLNSGNSSSASSSSTTNRTGTLLGATAPMSKSDSANTSTANSTGAVTAKETSATAPKRNVGMFRNMSDSNYSTVTPLSAPTAARSSVNSSKTTATLGATANVNSSPRSLAANTSTTNSTGAVTAKGTSATAPNRNSNYSKAIPVTSDGRVINPVHEFRATSVHTENSKCCIS